jgi:hypothetical protein
MYVLELLDSWANLQEREEGRKLEKSRFAKIYDEKKGAERLIKKRETPPNSTIKIDKSGLEKRV